MKIKKTAYIHIGLPKTGTTAIQSTLTRLFFAGKLDKFDMQFHNEDTWDGIQDVRYTKDENYFIEQLHKCILKFSKLGEKNVIFSSEHYAITLISGYSTLRYNILPLFATAFKDYNIKLIVYLRRQDIYIESVINQNMKIGIGANLDIASNINLYYKSLLDDCAKYFGKENLIVRKYERNSLYERDVVADFLHIVGLDDLISDYRKIEPEGYINQSLPLNSLRFAMADNKQYELSEAEIESKLKDLENQYKSGAISRQKYVLFSTSYITGRYNNLFPNKEEEQFRKARVSLLADGSKFSLSNTNQGLFTIEERQKILSKYAEENAAVAREFFENEDGVLFDDKMPTDVVDIHKELSTTEIVQMFMPIVTKLSLRCDNLERRCRELEMSAFEKFRLNTIRRIGNKLRKYPKLFLFVFRIYKGK